MVCAAFAFIDGLGGPEMVLIFVLILVLFGGQKLPEFARGMGKSIREFKKAAAGVEEEFKRALEDDERKKTVPTIMPPAPVAALPENPAPDYPHDHSYDHTYDDAGPITEVETHSLPSAQTTPIPPPPVTGEMPAASVEPTPTVSDETPPVSGEPTPTKLVPVSAVAPSAPPEAAPGPATAKNPPPPPGPEAGHP